jgi:hypothetical protein
MQTVVVVREIYQLVGQTASANISVSNGSATEAT